MAKLNLSGLITGLDTVLKGIQEALPIAQQVGIPAVVSNVVTIGIAAVGAINNILDRKDDLKDALSTQDEAKLRAMLKDIQQVNDQLAEVIAASAPAEAPTGGSDEVASGNG